VRRERTVVPPRAFRMEAKFEKKEEGNNAGKFRERRGKRKDEG
jgi:hypothetical protein